jgi:hypothetical protein
MNRTARILLVTSLVIAGLLVLGGVLNSETPPAFWSAIAWIVLVIAFNASIGARRQRKACPQCAEAVLAAATVCRHCGFRFDPEPATAVAD